MRIILKENNIIYTKKKQEKFLGSSKYTQNQFINTIYQKKEKLKPNNHVYEDAENEKSVQEDLTENLKALAVSNPKFAQIHHTYNLDAEPKKKEKKTEYKLNKKIVREKCSAFFGLKQSRKFLAFYSISYPMGFPDDYAFKCLNTLFT